MSARGFYTLFLGALMMLTALSVGSSAAFLLSVAAFCAWLFSLISVLIAFAALRLHQAADSAQTVRGERIHYTLSVRMFSPLPVSPLALQITLPSGRESEFLLACSMFGETVSENAFTCPHVGIFHAGVTRMTVRDCFGMFSFSRKTRAPLAQIVVLPNPVDSECPPFSPGEGEHSAAQRAQSDRTTPVDTRPWQEGDDLKRVHWKLSMRRQELMVHTYETPQRPDALILMDCTQPACLPSQRAQMIDALTEHCAGVAQALLEAGHPVRMPLCGKTTRELAAQDASALHGMLEALALEPFDVSAGFDRVLLLSARRMRRTGTTVIFTSHLTAGIADTVIALSRMGPRTQFTLITAQAPDEQQEKLLHLLCSSGITARHVTA